MASDRPPGLHLDLEGADPNQEVDVDIDSNAGQEVGGEGAILGEVTHRDEEAVEEEPPASAKSEDSLDEDAIIERVRLRTPALVGEVYSIAKEQVSFQERQQAAIYSRANTLIGAAGVSVTLMPSAGSSCSTTRRTRTLCFAISWWRALRSPPAVACGALC